MKTQGKILDKLDFIFNKLIPKKFVIILLICTMRFRGINLGAEFYIMISVYFTGSSAIGVAKGRKNGC